MIESSTKWNDLYKKVEEELLPESDIRIINTNDVVAPIEASNVSQSSILSPYSDMTHVATCENSATRNEPQKKIATAELNSYILDGSFKLWKDSNDNVREFVSNEICDENCKFTNPPYIRIYNLKNIKAVTQTFRTIKFAPNRKEYATSIKFVTNTYDGNNISNTSTITQNAVLNEYNTDYVMLWAGSRGTYYINEAYIYINAWNKPYRRARIQEYRIGKRFVWNKNNIMNTIKYNKSVDMVNAELPQNDFEFDFYDPDNDFDVWNPKAPFANAFNSNSVFTIYCGYLIDGVWEWKTTDNLFFREISRKSNSLYATIKLENTIQKMTQKFPKNRLNSQAVNNPTSLEYSWKSYKELINKIGKRSSKSITINSSAINSCLSIVKSFLSATYTGLNPQATEIEASKCGRGWNDYFNTEMKDMLQMVCQIVTAFIFVNHLGSIIIKSVCDKYGNLKAKSNFSVVDTIKISEMYNLPELERLERIKEVVINTLTPDFKNSEGALNMASSEMWVNDVLTYNFNDIGVSQSANNNLIFSKYDVYEDKGAKETKDYFWNPNATNFPPDYVSRFIYTMISEAIKISAETIINPLWEMGDLIAIETKNGSSIKTYQGFLIEMSIEYSGTFKGTVTILVPKSYQ